MIFCRILIISNILIICSFQQLISYYEKLFCTYYRTYLKHAILKCNGLTAQIKLLLQHWWTSVLKSQQARRVSQTTYFLKQPRSQNLKAVTAWNETLISLFLRIKTIKKEKKIKSIQLLRDNLTND